MCLKRESNKYKIIVEVKKYNKAKENSFTVSATSHFCVKLFLH